MPPSERARISLICTVKNEAASLPELLESIAAQSVAPDEIICVDGGSEDGTVAVLRRWQSRLPLHIIEAPGTSISVGRNLALAAAIGEIVAVTDGGVRLDRDWLRELVAPFKRDEAHQPDVVGGFFRADPRSRFEAALAAVTLPDEAEIVAKRFLPSSRSLALRRSWYQAGTRYPEWLDYCEDLILDLRLERAGARFEFQPRAFVWFRPRASARAFFLQYFHYARGDGKAGLFARRHAIRYGTYCLALPLLCRQRQRATARAALATGAVLYLRRPALRLLRRHDLSSVDLALAAGLLPVLRLTGDVAKMAGYPVGLWWRGRRFGLRRTWRDIAEESDPAAISAG